MKKLKLVNTAAAAAAVLLCALIFTGCIEEGTGYASVDDRTAQMEVADRMASIQPTPTDIDFSLERYNLTRRAYWVNGQHEKAAAVICKVEKPLGYIVLFAGNSVVGSFVVDGKVSSLNSYLTPDSDYFEITGEGWHTNRWLADVDGSYGENDSGIFFFTPDGKYIEWTGEYLYSDIPFDVSNPVVTVREEQE